MSKTNKIHFEESHQKKLKEMIVDLFPEYDLLDVSSNGLVFLSNQEGGITWFEFCLTKLVSRLAENFNTIYVKEKAYLMLDIITKKTKNYTDFTENHPVDYLYENYKKTLI
jgi:hypothetical protein